MITTFPNRRYNQGTDNFGPIQVPVGATKITLSCTRNAWPDTGGDILSVMVQISFDGGVTWRDHAGFTAPGGDIIMRDGSILPLTVIETQLPDINNPQRQIKGTITIFKALSSAVTIELA